MAHVNRRIGKSSETANPNADGTGGGVLDAFLHDYFQRSGNVVNVPGTGLANKGITATGGAINDYLDPSPGAIYRAHMFTSSGTFVVSDTTSDYGSNVEYLVVAGGGAGGNIGGGGGAGGFRTNMTGHPLAGSAFPVTAQSYTVTIGAGGASAAYNTVGGSGGDSVFGSITSNGGGGGGSRGSGPVYAGVAGGSGGGGGQSSTSCLLYTSPSPRDQRGSRMPSSA